MATTEVNSLVEKIECKFVGLHKWWHELPSLHNGSSTMSSQRETILLYWGILRRSAHFSWGSGDGLWPRPSMGSIKLPSPDREPYWSSCRALQKPLACTNWRAHKTWITVTADWRGQADAAGWVGNKWGTVVQALGPTVAYLNSPQLGGDALVCKWRHMGSECRGWGCWGKAKPNLSQLARGMWQEPRWAEGGSRVCVCACVTRHEADWIICPVMQVWCD